MKTSCVFIVLIILLFTGGCVQTGYLDGNSASVAPAVVFEPSESSSLLSCMNEVQGLTRKDLVSYSAEVAERLDQEGEEDVIKYICLSLHPNAAYKQFKRGKKLLNQYVTDHPDSSGDMLGLLLLVNQLDRARVAGFSGRSRLQEERDRLAAQVASCEMEAKQSQSHIQELQRQIDQLKNIENIIKNREHTK